MVAAGNWIWTTPPLSGLHRHNLPDLQKYFSEQVEICKEAGLITNTSLVMGYPQETPETIKQTMDQLEKLRVYPSTGFLLPLPETGMWNYAIDNGYITDIDYFLTQITERQDFSLNLTKMTEKQLKSEVVNGLNRLNKKFGNDLAAENLLKTGGYDVHSKSQNKDRAKLKGGHKLTKGQLRNKFKVDRNENTVETLNYATQKGTIG